MVATLYLSYVLTLLYYIILYHSVEQEIVYLVFYVAFLLNLPIHTPEKFVKICTTWMFMTKTSVSLLTTFVK